MKNNRKVRIAFTSTTATFTQRGKNPRRGFIRLNGKTVGGVISPDYVDKGLVFYTHGQNSELPYQGDSGSW